MKCALACIFAIAGWYLLYPPATQQSAPDSQVSLSKWEIDGPYGTAADCDAAYRDDLNSMVGLRQNSNDFLQTLAGRCVAFDDHCLAKHTCIEIKRLGLTEYEPVKIAVSRVQQDIPFASNCG
jgi:hypothetical protein